MTDSRSRPSADHLDALDALGARAVTDARAVAQRRVAGLPEASRLVDRGRRRRAARLVTVVAAAALILLSGAVLVQARTRRDADVVDVAAADARSAGSATDVEPAHGQEPSSTAPPTLGTAEPGLGPADASGWLPYTGDDVLHPEPGGLAGLKGYLHSGENVALGKAPVYDAPEGVVVGYAYSQLGFVNVADDATFDAHAERVARFGCDAFQDTACQPAGLEVPTS